MNKFCLSLIFLFTIMGIVEAVPDSSIVLEPWAYNQDFETRELSAWASYPLWQDVAYDEKIRVNTIVPGDSNLSLEQKVIPYSNVDNYAGAQKLFDIYFIPGSKLSLRFYLKTQLPAEYFKIRLAAGADGKIDYTIMNPPTNRWQWISITYDDFIRQNAQLKGKHIKVNALAILAKFPNADPAMPIYLCLDDISIEAARAMQFKFETPEMYKLTEWKPYIPRQHYHENEKFVLSGSWNLDADRVAFTITPFTKRSDHIYQQNLKREKTKWFSEEIDLSFSAGLYYAFLTAYKGEQILSRTEFTLYIAPKDIGNNHPRLWFDEAGEKQIKKRLNSDRFKFVKEMIIEKAKEYRENLAVDSVIYDIDQFNDEIWIPTISAYFSRLHSWGEGVYYNALAYRLLGDLEAGQYAKELMVKLCAFPSWLHPWMSKRGRHIYYPVGELGMRMAVGYDLCYGLFDQKDKSIIRSGLKDKIIDAAHAGYVEDNLATPNSSNWIAHIIGGSLMCQAVMYGEKHEFGVQEPYFTGAILKEYALIQNAFGDDGGYGEGYGYYNFTMLSFSKSLPVLENVFKIDLSEKVNHSYEELIWAGVIKKKKTFYFGDSAGDLHPLTNWAWLLPKYKDPLLGWFYNYMKNGETLMDVIYETKNVPQQDPFNENPDKVFRDIGTTVFKNGWEIDDFVFVMRIGPFINHQHLDQGTFWLYDNGKTFIGERHGSSYYKQLTYQSHYIQPISHSTILIDKNPQSQRTGDQFGFAEGFNDYAYLTHYLDGNNTAFSSGEIGKLYWGKVKRITRNVLYLKPSTILMLDEITPADQDVDVSLLYQTHYLQDIKAGKEFSTISIDDNVLYIYHVTPQESKAQAEEIIHFYGTLLNEKPLIREGYLSVTAKTAGKPLVMANVLIPSHGITPEINLKHYDNYYKGTVNGRMLAFRENQPTLYQTDGITSDALVISWGDKNIFAAKCTRIRREGRLLLESKMPLTCEISDEGIKYYLSESAKIKLGVNKKPLQVLLGDKIVPFTYHPEDHTIGVDLPAGEGFVQTRY